MVNVGGWRRGIAVVAVAVACAACGRGGHHTAARPGATVPPAAPTTVTTALPADPYAVPAVIDVAYLNRVFDVFEQVDGEATRAIVATRAFVPEAAIRLRAIYDRDEFDRQQEQWLRTLDRGVDGFDPQPTNLQTDVERIISARNDCVYVAVRRRFAGVVRKPTPDSVEFVALRTLDRPESRQFNPTPWMITVEGFNRDRSQPPDPCAAA